MKNLKNLILLTVILFISFFVISCSNNNDDISDGKNYINITLSIEINGVLSNSPKLTFNDEQGEIKSQVLLGNWTKKFVVKSGYKMFIKATGTVNGSISVKATATGDNLSINRNVNESGNSKVFDIEISEILN